MIAAARRGRGPFITLFWRHVGSLSKAPGLPAASRAILQRIETAQRGGFPARLRALFIPGFSRQAWAEDLIFRLWFLLG